MVSKGNVKTIVAENLILKHQLLLLLRSRRKAPALIPFDMRDRLLMGYL